MGLNFKKWFKDEENDVFGVERASFSCCFWR